jgi:hypothetical protein
MRTWSASCAATKLIILDCCYAETANQANFGTQSAGLTDAYPVDGLYFLGASKRRETAGFPLHGDQTYFTEAFIDTVRTGIPGQPPAPELTLSEIFRVLRGSLKACPNPPTAASGPLRPGLHRPWKPADSGWHRGGTTAERTRGQQSG